MMTWKGKSGITGAADYNYSSDNAAVVDPGVPILRLGQEDTLLNVMELHAYFFTSTSRERKRKDSIKQVIDVITCTLLN